MAKHTGFPRSIFDDDDVFDFGHVKDGVLGFPGWGGRDNRDHDDHGHQGPGHHDHDDHGHHHDDGKEPISPLPYNAAAFPDGVSSGDVTQTSAVLWARAGHTGKVTFQVATDADFRHIIDVVTVNVGNTLVPANRASDTSESPSRQQGGRGFFNGDGCHDPDSRQERTAEPPMINCRAGAAHQSQQPSPTASSSGYELSLSPHSRRHPQRSRSSCDRQGRSCVVLLPAIACCPPHASNNAACKAAAGRSVDRPVVEGVNGLRPAAPHSNRIAAGRCGP